MTIQTGVVVSIVLYNCIVALCRYTYYCIVPYLGMPSPHHVAIAEAAQDD